MVEDKRLGDDRRKKDHRPPKDRRDPEPLVSVLPAYDDEVVPIRSEAGRFGIFLKELNRQKYSFLFIAPGLILFTIFVLIPVVTSLFWSFTRYNVFQPPIWVGLDNYRHILFHDPRFWKAIKNTVLYVGGTVPAGIVIALMLSIAIDQQIRFKGFFKTMFFMPAVTAIVAISVIWKWLYAGEKYGLINYLLIKMGFQPVDWLLSPAWTLPAIMIMSVWAGLGYNIILFTAGLSAIPKRFYEAAEIDGANAWDKFWNVTLPLLMPTMLFVVVMSVIASFQVFDQVYIMTGGTEEGIGGILDSALTIVAYLYDMGFQKFRMGYASALAYLIFAIIFGATLVNFKMMRSKIEY
ncbi:MAG: sugar ABC transporter permease [Candidatus Omnitrophica bacterium]|nr:sugar ABC transporter permease [Candidatus Omnitrophota bacterium]